MSCKDCALLEYSSCILQTNCTANLSKVEIIFIAENPGKNEIDTQIPLIGASGQVFRKYFDYYFKPYFNYLITNTVLCQTLNKDGTTGNPSWYITEHCSNNCFQIIEEICNPALVVIMGSTAMRAFDLGRSGILSLRGHVYTWRNYDIFLTVHPSYVLRTGNYKDFEVDLRLAHQYLKEKLINKRKIKIDHYPSISYSQFLKKFFVIRE